MSLELLPVDEEKLIQHLANGFACQIPLCCNIEFSMYMSGLREKPKYWYERASMGHSGFPVVLFTYDCECGECDESIVMFLATTEMDEYRMCLSCIFKKFNE